MLIVIVGALCAVLIITASALVVYYGSVVGEKDQQISSLGDEVARLNTEVNALNSTVKTLNETLAQKNSLIEQQNNEISDFNNQITSLNSQIAALQELSIDASGLTVEDLRGTSSYALHIYGRVNNPSEAIAYNAVLHVMAFNAEGLAIDNYHYFGGITGGMSVGLDFIIEYTGSPIESWQITPIWTNQMVMPVNGTFSP